jgi:hypothetical protein
LYGTSSLPVSFGHLSDEALLAELHACVATSRENDARMVLFLIEVDVRRLYLARAYSSMYDFCKRKLGLSDGQTCRRLAAARLVKDYPFILPLLVRGETHMSTLAQIRSFVTPKNAHALIAETAGKNRHEVDYILAQRFNLDRTSPSSRDVIVIDRELETLIQRAYELDCHAVPDGDRLELTKRAYRALIAAGEKKQRAKTERPRPPPTQRTKTIPRASTREMFAEHGEQCCYVDPISGERCPSRVFIQRNHRDMRVHGGTHESTNLEPVCGPHNRYLAALALGRERIDRAIRLRQRRLANGTDDPDEGSS